MTTLPTDVEPDDPGHAALHNQTNAEINAATPNNVNGALIRRGATNGGISVGEAYADNTQPGFPNALTRKDYVDGLVNAQGTGEAVGNGLVRRFPDGSAAFSDVYIGSGANNKATRKDYVDGIGTVNPTPGAESVVRRNVAGDAGFHRAYSYGGSPALDPEELTRKDYVDNIGEEENVAGAVVRRYPDGSFVTGTIYLANAPASASEAVRRSYVDPITSISATPSRIGQLAVVAGVGYMATGTGSSADWKQITA